MADAPSPAPQLELTGARVELGGAAVLQGVDLTVRAGEAVALVGPSGSGKTTLLRLLGGALPPSAGDVRLLGQERGALDPRALRALRTRLGFVHQDLALVPNLRALTNVLAARLGRRGLLAGLRSVLRPAEAEVLAAHASTAARTACPGASSSAWPWPAPCTRTPRSCWRTSPWPPWTRPAPGTWCG